MKRNFVSLGEISEIMGGYAFKSSMMSDEPKKYQIIKMSNLYRGVLDLSRSPSFWENVDSKTERYLLKENDILMTLTGTVGKRDYGYTVQLKNENNLLLNQRVCCIRPRQKKVHTFYLFQYLRTQEFLNKFFDCSIGGTGNQSNVGISDLRELDIYLPPSTEQKAISDLLSTWDEAIERTERLIQAKEKRFKWLLRKLISEPQNAQKDTKWKKTTLGDICKITMGSSPSSNAYNNAGIGLPLLQGKADLKNRKSSPRLYTAEITKTCSIGDLLMSVRAPVGYISFAEHRCCIGRGIAAFSINKNCSRDFVFYSLLASEHKWVNISQGGTFEAISGPELKKFRLLIPLLETQKQIAETLLVAQKEIELLNQLAEKYKDQKHGLMQKVITGKWRVKFRMTQEYKEF